MLHTPTGADVEPWLAGADEILTRHQQYYRALCAAWRRAADDHQASEKELAGIDKADPDPLLPAEAARLAEERRKLWQDTARQRIALATAHADLLAAHAARAARDYAAVALAAYRAAVAHIDPLGRLTEPGNSDDWDEQRLAPPPETGIAAIDIEATKLRAVAMGKPVRRRGPAPKKRSRLSTAAPARSVPGSDLAALADFLRGHLVGGALIRRLHP
ncbi:hypothetical protein AB0H36_47510 [Kribbella sp. NPDC050820]|uniref:hypothetical protein n=1 Tax=Kribbella sp. NPDC050820 TaxID=3155408 RepID=UPI0033EF56C9